MKKTKQQPKKQLKAKRKLPKKQTPKLKTETIEVEVDKVHALVIKEYEGMVIDVFTKQPVERFMKPIEGCRVSKVTIELEELPPIEPEPKKE